MATEGGQVKLLCTVAMRHHPQRRPPLGLADDGTCPGTSGAGCAGTSSPGSPSRRTSPPQVMAGGVEAGELLADGPQAGRGVPVVRALGRLLCLAVGEVGAGDALDL